MPRISQKPQYIDEVKRLYLEEKLSLSEISEQLPVSVQTLSRWLMADGIELEPRPRNPNAGRTAEQQEEINRKIRETWQNKIATGNKPAGRTPRVPRETRTCQCGKSFTVLGTSPQRYCSMHCARFHQARAKQAEVRQAWLASDASSCACGSKIPYEHRDTWKYCSPECRETYGAKRQKNPANHVTFNCQNCGKSTTRYKNYGNGHLKYCSNDCARKHTKTRRFYAVEGFDVVFESSWEALFWSLCAFLKVPVERYTRDEGVEWRTGSWYAPDFWLPSLELAIEVKGKPDTDDLTRWSIYRARKGELAIVDRATLDRLRAASDALIFTSLLKDG